MRPDVKEAMRPDMKGEVKGDVAMKAVALNTMGFSMMRIFGPVLAGYLIAWFGAAGSFFVQGVLYAAS